MVQKLLEIHSILLQNVVTKTCSITTNRCSYAFIGSKMHEAHVSCGLYAITSLFVLRIS